MLCADENTFLDLKVIFGNWYYMLISFISYSNPTFNISDLHMHLASKVAHFTIFFLNEIFLI
jgi:hypothetical protein